MMTTIRRVWTRLLGGSRVSPSGTPFHSTAPLAELGNRSLVCTTGEPTTSRTARRIRLEAFEEVREPFDLLGEDW